MGELLRAIFDEALDAMVLADDDGRYVEVNPAACTLFGLPREQLLQHRMADFAAPGFDAAAAWAEFRRAGRVKGEFRLVRLDGNVRDLEFSATADILPHRHLSVLRDVTDRKAQERDNARLYHEAREASRMKDEFLATLSHELRTPLNAILGWAQLLRDGKLDAVTSSRAVEAIERNARVQTQLISDILDVSRIVSGKLRLDVRPLELGRVVGAALETVRPAAEARGIRLEAVTDTPLDPISGDGDRLQQVVWNLLANAIKFTPSGGQVTVRTRRTDTYVELSVEDDGIGIDPAMLPHVFERFRQADSSSTRVHGGLGLGLALVRHLVELHGGTVSAASAGPGRGATFTVRLPLLGVFRHAAAPPAPAPWPATPLAGVKVLLVDDEADARDLFKTLLEQSGARVTAVGSGAEAFSSFTSSPPDVLVSDIEMPEENGYDLIRRLRDLPPEQGGRVPAAALTAYARVEDRLRALHAGFQVHVTKPVQPQELVATIASLAGRG